MAPQSVVVDPAVSLRYFAPFNCDTFNYDSSNRAQPEPCFALRYADEVGAVVDNVSLSNGGLLSGVPVVWGDPAKLRHLSSRNSVDKPKGGTLKQRSSTACFGKYIYTK